MKPYLIRDNNPFMKSAVLGTFIVWASDGLRLSVMMYQPFGTPLMREILSIHDKMRLSYWIIPYKT
jgi:hypothetical protein